MEDESNFQLPRYTRLSVHPGRCLTPFFIELETTAVFYITDEALNKSHSFKPYCTQAHLRYSQMGLSKRPLIHRGFNEHTGLKSLDLLTAGYMIKYRLFLAFSYESHTGRFL